LKKTIRWLSRLLLWVVAILATVELVCFAVITCVNWFIYGSPREGSRVRYDPYALYLNRDGPRHTPGNREPADGRTWTLWLMGGSTMRGDTDEDAATIPAVLARRLNSTTGETAFRVLNFGENSFNALLETNYLQKLLIERRDQPDLILFYDGANEGAYLSQYRTPYGHHGYRRFSALVESYHNSLFGLLKPLNAAFYASFTRELFQKIRHTLIPLETGTPVLVDYLDQSEKRYDHLHRTARCLGIRFLVMLQPVWWAETTPVAPSVVAMEAPIRARAKLVPALRHNYRTLYDGLADRLKHKPYFVNLRHCLVHRKTMVYKEDGVHMTDEGRRMVAEAMENALKQKVGFVAAAVPRGQKRVHDAH
jgi:lysophospholipase L1-like esterase